MVEAIVVLLLLLALLALPRGKPRPFDRADKEALDRYDDRARGKATYPFDPQ